MSDWLIEAEAESRLGETTEARAVPELTWLPRLTDHAVSTLPVGIQTNFVTSTHTGRRDAVGLLPALERLLGRRGEVAVDRLLVVALLLERLL